MYLGEYIIKADLKPCPFCGREISGVTVIHNANQRDYYIKCKCGIETPLYASKQGVENKWNKRKG